MSGKIFIILKVCFLFLAIQSQAKVTLDCQYVNSNFGQICNIYGAVIKDLNEEVLISGTHPSSNDPLVRTVQFHNSKLSHIPNILFYTFRNLEWMHAENSNLQSIGELKYCNNLRYLYVENNTLTELPGNSVTACSQLHTIQAKFNQISKLDKGFMLRWKSVTYLGLIGNKFKVLDLGTLESRTRISIHFSFNPLERIEGSFIRNASYDTISINDCNVEEIDPEILKGFDGTINRLNLKMNLCVDAEFNKISADNVGEISQSLEYCFDNFAPSPTSEPATTQGPAIGKLLCKLDVSRRFYNCETKAEVILTDEL